MRIQKFRGKLKKDGAVLENLQLRHSGDNHWFVHNLRWIVGVGYDGSVYSDDDFEEIEEYFEEIDGTNRGPDWFIKAQTAK